MVNHFKCLITSKRIQLNKLTPLQKMTLTKVKIKTEAKT